MLAEIRIGDDERVKVVVMAREVDREAEGDRRGGGRLLNDDDFESLRQFQLRQRGNFQRQGRQEGELRCEDFSTRSIDRASNPDRERVTRITGAVKRFHVIQRDRFEAVDGSLIDMAVGVVFVEGDL